MNYRIKMPLPFSLYGKKVFLLIFIFFWIDKSIFYIVITPMVTMHCNDNASKIYFYEKHHKEKLNYGII